MARYLLISAVIVVGLTTIVAAYVNRDMIRIKLASVYVKVPPKPQAPATPDSATPRPLRIDAPWVLSALPECLTQLSDTTGPNAYVLAHLPAGARRVPPQSTLVYGPCSISVGSQDAWVFRGMDRFYVPPRVEFYRAGGTLALLRRDGPGMDLRVYQPAQP